MGQAKNKIQEHKAKNEYYKSIPRRVLKAMTNVLLCVPMLFILMVSMGYNDDKWMWE